MGLVYLPMHLVVAFHGKCSRIIIPNMEQMAYEARSHGFKKVVFHSFRTWVI